MDSVTRWSATKVVLLAAAWLIAVPAALVGVTHVVAWYRMRGAAPVEPYWVSADVGGWWVPLVWFGPPVVLAAVRVWRASDRR